MSSVPAAQFGRFQQQAQLEAQRSASEMMLSAQREAEGRTPNNVPTEVAATVGLGDITEVIDGEQHQYEVSTASSDVLVVEPAVAAAELRDSHTDSYDTEQADTEPSAPIPETIIQATRRANVARLNNALVPQVHDVRFFKSHYQQQQRKLTQQQLRQQLLNKGEVYRNLTMPRLKVTTIPATNEKFYTIGSHVTTEPYFQCEPSIKHIQVQPQKATTNSGQQAMVDTYHLHSLWHFSDSQCQHYGLGVGMYMQYTRQLAWLFLFLFFAAVPIMLLSYSASADAKSASGYGIEKLTLGNFGYTQSTNQTYNPTLSSYTVTKDNAVWIASISDTFYTVVFTLFAAYTLYHQSTVSQHYHKNELTVAQFTLQVTNLPSQCTRLDIYRLFSKYGNVVEVVIYYNDTELLKLYDQRGKLMRQLQALRENHADQRYIDDALYAVRSVDADIADTQRELSDKQAVAACVTFAYQQQRRHCLKHWRNSLLTNRLRDFTLHRYPLICSKGQEPSNLITENFTYTPTQKAVRRLATAIGTLLMLGVTVAIIYAVQQLQIVAQPETIICPQSSYTYAEAQLSTEALACYCTSLGAAVVTTTSDLELCSTYIPNYIQRNGWTMLAVVTIVLVNAAINKVCRWFAAFEKHNSFTSMQRSMTAKLFVSLFLNTALVILIVNANFRPYLHFALPFSGRYSDFTPPWFSTVGVSIQLTMMLNSVWPTTLPVIKHLIHSYKRVYRVPEQPTPADIRRLYEGAEFELSGRYARVLSTMFVCMLFASMMPLMLLIAAITFAMVYFVDKYTLLRYYRTPARMDQQLAVMTSKLMPVAAIFHLMFSVWMYSSPVMTTTAPTTDWEAIQHESVWHRLQHTNVAPVSICLAVLLAAYAALLLAKLCDFQLCKAHAHTDVSSAVQTVSYWQAQQTVQLESYHIHYTRQYQDAFIRTPSFKQLRPEPDLMQLLESAAASAAEKYEQQMMAKQKLEQQQKLEQERVEEQRRWVEYQKQLQYYQMQQQQQYQQQQQSQQQQHQHQMSRHPSAASGLMAVQPTAQSAQAGQAPPPAINQATGLHSHRQHPPQQMAAQPQVVVLVPLRPKRRTAVYARPQLVLREGYQ